MRKLFSDDSLFPIIQQSIQHKCYFAHPENVLLIMLGDDDKAIGAKPANMISKVGRNNKIEAHNHTSFGSFIFPDAISMQNATLKSLTFTKKDEQLLPTFETIKESWICMNHHWQSLALISSNFSNSRCNLVIQITLKQWNME